MKPEQLHDLQQWMQQALVTRGEPASTEAIEQYIAASPTLTPAQRLAIYQRGYYARLLQCLEGQFKALHQTLGAELFRDFGIEYLREFPSVSPTLGKLGSSFVTFLQNNRPDKDAPETWVDFMIDLARFEWELYQLFDAAGAEETGYATTDAPDEQLVLQPALRLLQLSFPVGAYYHALIKNEDPELPGPEDSRVVLVRTGYRIAILNLTPAQFCFLQHLQAGEQVNDALAKTAETFGVNEADAQLYWQKWKTVWMNWGLFVT